MTLLRFDPPGHLRDFDHIPNQLQQWSDAVSGWINGGIEIEKQRLSDYPQAQVQFFNATQTAPAGLSLDQAIVWNAFPRTLVLGYGGRAAAFPESEKLISLTAPRPGLPTASPFYQDPPDYPGMWSSLYYRPLDEYCEWRVERAADTGKIQRITFTSEPPEYWQALHGDKLQDVNGDFAYQFTGDKQRLLELYREFVSPEVQLADLACQQDYFYLGDDGKPVPVFRKGDYNPYNVWNSTKGLMHLAHPNNFVAAEIQLGCDATLLRHKNDRPVVQADALVCCAGYGGTSRSSDPTIGASINDLARLGAWVTIKNPIGLYMHDLNTEGFTKPNGEPIDPQEYFRVLRGDQKAGMIERAVFEVPAGEGFTVGDIRIGGVPITWGGQVAEHLNITITGTAVAPGTFQNPLLPCATFCAINQILPRALTRVIANGSAVPDGSQQAFQYEQGTFGNMAAKMALAEANARLQPAAAEPPYREPHPVPRHKRR